MEQMNKPSADTERLEAQLFKAADKLRKNIDAAQYKHIVLGLIFLKYISDSFLARYEELTNTEFADPEDPDEYAGENVFWVPPEARWDRICAQAKQPGIGQILDKAMELIEKDNSTLKGILPKVFARMNVASATLGELIDLISNIALAEESARSKDVLGRVYEYFLGEFALAEGKKGGQFYTPSSIVKLLVADDRTLFRQGVRPLLRQRRHVRNERKICGKPPGKNRRHLHLRPGKQ